MKAYLSATDNLFINNNAQPIEVDVCVIDDEHDTYVLVVASRGSDDQNVFYCSSTDVATFVSSIKNADQMIMDFEFNINQYQTPTHIKCICNTQHFLFTYFELDIDVFEWNSVYMKQFDRDTVMDIKSAPDPDIDWIYSETAYDRSTLNEMD